MFERNSIEIIDLLHEREVEFMRIWRCEQEIKALLPFDFPLPPPPDLPSRRKVVKPAKAVVRKPEPVKKPAPGIDIRRLDVDGENAYRLVYIYNGKEEYSFQTDRELVRLLGGLNAVDFTLLSVESVKFKDMEHWDCVEVLWKRGESPQGEFQLT